MAAAVISISATCQPLVFIIADGTNDSILMYYIIKVTSEIYFKHVILLILLNLSENQFILMMISIIQFCQTAVYLIHFVATQIYGN